MNREVLRALSPLKVNTYKFTRWSKTKGTMNAKDVKILDEAIPPSEDVKPLVMNVLEAKL